VGLTTSTTPPDPFDHYAPHGGSDTTIGGVPPPADDVERVELKAPIRMVAIDLDGTLLNDSKQVTKQTLRSISCLPSRGVKVVIATARPPRSVRHIYEQLGLDTFQINYNGALIWDEPRKVAVFHRPMAGALVRELIARGRDLYADLLVSCEVMDRWYTDRHDPQYTTETGRLFKPDVICSVDEMCRQPVTKLMFLGHPELITALEPEFGAADLAEKITAVRADADLIQIMDRRVSKAVAMMRIAQHYGVAKQQIMAIGDAPNDVGMLQAAGVAVAVDNAHERVKAVADWVAPSNNDHGVHAALVRYGLCD
jgi:5-amino-6-(5-phospho-D-ribitylamino)uracil phosphatase